MVELSHLRDLFASISETTLPPALITPAATGSKNGPVPATTTRLPARTPCPFNND